MGARELKDLGKGGHWVRWWAALLVMVVTGVVYRGSPVGQVYDGKYAGVLAEVMYRRGTMDLGGVVGVEESGELPYQLERVGGRVMYKYPVGVSVMSVPVVMVLNGLGVSAIGPDGRYDAHGEGKMEQWVAAVMTAWAVGMVLVAAMRLTTVVRAVGVAVAVGLGTGLWSTASRGMWSQTGEVFLLAGALAVMTGGMKGWRRGVVLGVLMGAMWVTRPTGAVSIGGILIYEMVRDWRSGVWAGVAGLMGLGIFVGWSEWVYGGWRPGYYGMGLDWGDFGEALAGQVVSPSRGLLVFTPWVAGVGYLLVRYWRGVRERGLVWVGVGVMVGQWVVISAWGMWWFGHCYGPRAWVEVMPWVGVMGAACVGEMRWKWEWWVMGVLVGVSMVMHGEGAWSREALAWNVVPANVDGHPERVWSWGDAQWMRGFEGKRVRIDGGGGGG